MMATAIQENGIKPFTNGNHVKLEDVDVKSEVVEVKSEDVDVKSETCVSAVEENESVENSESHELDIVINNVVCSFSVRCHLNLRQIALHGANVEYRRENGMITMKLRKPYTTASVWSSGKITCTGATSEDQAKVAARRYARCLQKLGFRAKFNNYRVVNVLGTCSMPFAIKITAFSEKYRHIANYEPELHPGVTYKLTQPKATLKIFSTGSVTVTAPSVADVQAAIEHIYPLVYEFRKERSKEDLLALELKRKGIKRKRNNTRLEVEELQTFQVDVMSSEEEIDDDEEEDEEEEEDYDSDQSWD